MANIDVKVPCLACSERLVGLECDGQYPCTSCRQSRTTCFYPPPAPVPSTSTAEHGAEFERWSHQLELTPGTFAAARLAPEYDTRGNMTAFKWQQATEQRQDLRIRPHPTRPPIRRLVSNITAHDESEAIEAQGDRLASASRVELFRQFTRVVPEPPVHPSILLSAIVADRPPSRDTPSNVNLSNCLGVSKIVHHDGSTSTCVAWRRGDASTGGRGSTLGWAQTRPSTSDETTFSRLNTSSKSFLDNPHISPITQVELASLPTPSAALLATRSLTHFTLHHLSIPSSSAQAPKILSSFQYTSSDFARRPIASFSLSPYEAGQGLVVDTHGSVFGFGLGVRGAHRIGDGDWKGGRPDVYRLRTGKQVEKGGEFRRVAWGGRADEVVMASEKEVVLYDLRSPRSSLKLYSNPSSATSPITSLLTPSSSSSTSTFFSAISTPISPLTILDSRLPLHPVLSFPTPRLGRSGKGHDRTLSLFPIASLPTESSSIWRIGLHSRLSSGMMIYSLDSKGSVVRSGLDPYFISGDGKKVGVGVVREGEDGWRLMECGREGELWERGLKVKDEAEEEEEGTRGAEAGWQDERLDQGTRSRVVGVEWAKSHELKGLRGLGKRLFEQEEERTGIDVRAAIEAELDEAELAEPRGMRTLYDVLAQGGFHEPDAPRRLSGASKRPCISQTDLDDLVQHEETLEQRAASVYQHFEPSAPTGYELGSLAALAQLYDHPPPLSSAAIHDHSGSLQQRYNASSSVCDRLSLDLALSNRVYSDRPIVPNPPPSTINRPLPARLSSSMQDDDSDGEGLPSLHFSYFRPRRSGRFTRPGASMTLSEGEEDADEEAGEEEEADWRKPSLKSRGVRRILAEWHLGSDPRSYAWEDLYDDAAREGKKKDDAMHGNAVSQFPESSQAMPPSIFTHSQRSMPPSIVVQAPSGRSKRVVEITDEPRPPSFGFSATQPAAFPSGPPSSSQGSNFGVVASQIVPGVFGARPPADAAAAAKAKKKAKKRVSGF